MAQGDVIVFNKAKVNFSGLIDLSNTTDFKVMLITTLPTIGQTTPDSADFIQVDLQTDITSSINNFEVTKNLQ